MRKNKLSKSITLSLACLLGIGTAVGVSSLGDTKHAVRTDAASIVIGTDARDNYKKWNSESTMCVSTMFYINTGKSGTSGSATDKGITYTWSGGATLEKASSYIEIVSGGTFTVTLTNIPNYQYLTFTRNSIYDAKGSPDLNLTITVTCGSKSSTASGVVANGNYLNAFLDIKGGNSSTLTFSVTNNSSGRAYLASDWFDIYHGVNITYTFDKKGGSGGSDNASVWYYFPYSNITIPTRSGYKFLGYFDAETGGNKFWNADGTATNQTWLLDPSSSAHSNQKLYAQWEVSEQTVNITAGKGVKSVYLSTNQNATSGSASGSKFNANTTVYGFAVLAKGYNAPSNWTLVSGTANTEGAKYRVSSKTVGSSTVNFGTFNANVASYTITLNKQGGTGGDNSVTAYYDSAMPNALMPTKTGYNFNGYYTKTNGAGTKYYNANGTSAKKWDLIANTTLYAYWTYVSEIQNVVDKITAIGEVSYPDSKEAIEDAEAAYEALSPTYQDVIMEYALDLLDAREYYNDLRDDAVLDTMILIEEIGEATYPESHDALFAAEEAYAALDEDDLDLVENYEDMVDARDVYDEQKAEAAQEVMDAIDLIKRDNEGNITYPGSKESLENAEELYNNLAPEEKNEEDILNLEDLIQAREDYNDLRDRSVQDVIDAINAIEAEFNKDRKEEISYADELFYALDEDQQNDTWVTNLSRLEAAHVADQFCDSIEEIGLARDTEEFRELIEGILEDYNALSPEEAQFVPEELLVLLDDYKMGIYMMDLINDIGEVTLDKEDYIEYVRYLYDNFLTIRQKTFVANYITLVNAEKSIEYLKESIDRVANVESLINTIGEVTYPGSKDKIQKARNAYNKLSEAEKAEVSNYDVLLAAEEAYNNLMMVDVNNVINLINAIGELEYSQDCKNKIDAARNAYNALNVEQKSYVSNYNALTHAEDVYDNVAEVIAKINAIGEVKYDEESKGLIDDAREAYEKLSEEEKALVNNYQTLDADEILYNHVDGAVKLAEAIGEVSYTQACKDKIDAARNAYNSLTNEEKALYPEGLLKNIEDAEKAYDAMDKINAIGDLANPGSEEKLQAARDAYEALSGDQKALVDPALLKTLEDDEAALKVIKKINAIGEVKYEDASKALMNDARDAYDALTDAQKYLVYNYSTLVGDEAIYAHVDNASEAARNIGEVSYTSACKERIDNARNAYNSLTNEEKALYPNELLKALEDAEKAYDAMDKINAIGDLANPGSEAKLQEARNAYDALTRDQKALVSPALLKVLVDKEAALPVIKMIDDIGEINYSDACKAKIDKAQNAYNALTADQKALVYNYDKLQSGKADYAKVDNVAKEISNLGTVSYDKASKDKIEKARADYEALTQEQKNILPESYVKSLEDHEKTYEALAKIDALKNIEYDSESEETIKAAREAYDSLSEEQKALVNKADLDKLVAAEHSYQEKEQQADKLFLIMVIASGACLLIGLILLIILLKKINKVKKELKAMSVGGLSLLVLTSHLLGTKFIIGYALCGLSILILLIDFILLIRYINLKSKLIRQQNDNKNNGSKGGNKGPKAKRNYGDEWEDETLDDLGY